MTPKHAEVIKVGVPRRFVLVYWSPTQDGVVETPCDSLEVAYASIDALPTYEANDFTIYEIAAEYSVERRPYQHLFDSRVADKCGGNPCTDKTRCSCHYWADTRSV